MLFAQFYKLSTGYIAGTIPPRFSAEAVKPIEALGSDGVAILDGRLSMENASRAAADICKRRGFIGYSIHKGASFSQSSKCRPFVAVTN